MANSVGRPIRPVLGALAAAMLLNGCQGGGLPWMRPASSPPAVRLLRVAVVDLGRTSREHPRWAEVQALDRRIQDLVGQLTALAASPGISAPPAIDLTPELRAAAQQESEQLRPEFRKRMDAEASGAQAAARRELDAYAAKVRADQQAQFDVRRTAIEAEVQKAIQDKAQALQRDMAQFQQQTFEQYRLPLLNLHLKLDAVQQTDKKEADRLTQQLQTVTKERDDKIAAREKANQDALAAFQKQQQEAYVAQLKAAQDALSKDGQRLLDQKAAELSARVHTQLAAKQTQFNAELRARMQADLRARQQALVSAARNQVQGAQSQALRALQARVDSLRSQIAAAQAERARLLASITADVRVEAAALAQEKGYNLMLGRAIATTDAIDATADLIARIKK